MIDTSHCIPPEKMEYVVDGRSQDVVTGLHGKIKEKRIELKLSQYIFDPFGAVQIPMRNIARAFCPDSADAPSDRFGHPSLPGVHR